MIDIRKVTRLLWSLKLCLIPVVIVLIAPSIEGLFKTSERIFSPWNEFLFVLFALFFYIFPFILQYQMKKEQDKYKSIDSSHLLLNLGAGSSSTVLAAALMVFIYFGNSINWVYFWSAISFSISLYWCWMTNLSSKQMNDLEIIKPNKVINQVGYEEEHCIKELDQIRSLKKFTFVYVPVLYMIVFFIAVKLGFYFFPHRSSSFIISASVMGCLIVYGSTLKGYFEAMEGIKKKRVQREKRPDAL